MIKKLLEELLEALNDSAQDIVDDLKLEVKRATPELRKLGLKLPKDVLLLIRDLGKGVKPTVKEVREAGQEMADFFDGPIMTTPDVSDDLAGSVSEIENLLSYLADDLENS